MLKIVVLFIIFIISLILTASVSQFPSPSINYESEYRRITTSDYEIVSLSEDGMKGNKIISGASTSSLYVKVRALNTPKADFTQPNNITVSRNDIPINSDFSLIRYKSIPISIEQIFVIDEIQSQSIGYYLIDYFEITNVMNETIIQAIKSLTPDLDYLHGSYTLPPNFNIEFYKTENQGFIERYGILEADNGQIFLFLDAFYPQEIESNLEQYLIGTLNAVTSRLEPIE